MIKFIKINNLLHETNVFLTLCTIMYVIESLKERKFLFKLYKLLIIYIYKRFIMIQSSFAKVLLIKINNLLFM